MSEMTPWKMSPPEERPDEHVLALLANAGAVPQWPARRYASTYERLERSIARDSRRRWARIVGLSLVTATAALVLALLVRPVSHPAAPVSMWRTVSLGDVGTIEITARTDLRIEVGASEEADEQRVFVLLGEARAHITKRDPKRPFVLVTPHLRVVVVGTRFTVNVSSPHTEVAAQEGLVRIESLDGGSLALHAGQSATSDDVRLSRPAIPTPTPEPERPTGAARPTPRASQASGREDECRAKRSTTARRECLVRLAAGDGLPAQNALYALGLLEKKNGDNRAALAAWRSYARRFKVGLLAPETSIAILRALLDDKQYADALAQAESFDENFSTDPRRQEVALIRGKLVCLRFGRLPEALKAFAQALTVAQPSVREDALYSRGSCLDLLAGSAAAQEAWQAYVKEFPKGPHVREVESRLAK